MQAKRHARSIDSTAAMNAHEQKHILATAFCAMLVAPVNAATKRQKTFGLRRNEQVCLTTRILPYSHTSKTLLAIFHLLAASTSAAALQAQPK